VGLPATRRDYVRCSSGRTRRRTNSACIERRGSHQQHDGDLYQMTTAENGSLASSSQGQEEHAFGKGGLRVPLIIRWPGQLPANKTSPQVAITMDLTAIDSRRH